MKTHRMLAALAAAVALPNLAQAQATP